MMKKALVLSLVFMLAGALIVSCESSSAKATIKDSVTISGIVGETSFSNSETSKTVTIELAEVNARNNTPVDATGWIKVGGKTVSGIKATAKASKSAGEGAKDSDPLDIVTITIEPADSGLVALNGEADITLPDTYLTKTVTVSGDNKLTFDIEPLAIKVVKFNPTGTDEATNNAARAGNTNHVTDVIISQSETDRTATITITLDCVIGTIGNNDNGLKDFDGLNGWGIHKWLGIGVGVDGVSDLTEVFYATGSGDDDLRNLTDADVTEASTVGLNSVVGEDTSTTYFVRWVAADLVGKSDSDSVSKNTFLVGTSANNAITCTLNIRLVL